MVPMMISLSATEIANRIEQRDAISARPIHRANSSQILFTQSSFSVSTKPPPRAGSERFGGVGLP